MKTRVRDVQPIPRWPLWILRGVCLLVVLAVFIYPLLPADWFLAVNSATGEILTFKKGPTTRVPFHLLWALEGFRRLPDLQRGLICGVLLGLLLVPRKIETLFSSGVARRPDSDARRKDKLSHFPWLAGACGLAAVGLFYLLRVNYDLNAQVADASVLPGDVELGTSFAADALTYHAFHAVRGVLAVFVSEPSGLLAIVWTSCLAGGVFVVAMLALARTVAETVPARLTLFIGGALAGYAVLFCGYVETTQVELALMAVYFAAAAGALRSSVKSLRVQCLTLALAAVSLATMAHAAGVLLLPSAGILLLSDAFEPGMRWWQVLRRVLRARNVVLVGGLIVLPFVLVLIIPFYLQGDFGNTTGGGDDIRFVVWHYDDAAPVSRYTYYSFLSGRHLADLLSALLVAAPVALPLCLCAGVLVWRARARLETAESWWLALLATAAGSCFLIPLMWNHDFGMWGDWNIAACYLFPLNLFAWCLLTFTNRQRQDTAGFGQRLAVLLLLTQLLLAVGLLLQFR
ncbi:MAG: hypothetical protein ABIG44_14830 [Planctomycetota bacterium]